MRLLSGRTRCPASSSPTSSSRFRPITSMTFPAGPLSRSPGWSSRGGRSATFTSSPSIASPTNCGGMKTSSGFSPCSFSGSVTKPNPECVIVIFPFTVSSFRSRRTFARSAMRCSRFFFSFFIKTLHNPNSSVHSIRFQHTTPSSKVQKKFEKIPLTTHINKKKAVCRKRQAPGKRSFQRIIPGKEEVFHERKQQSHRRDVPQTQGRRRKNFHADRLRRPGRGHLSLRRGRFAAGRRLSGHDRARLQEHAPAHHGGGAAPRQSRAARRARCIRDFRYAVHELSGQR